MLPIVQAHEVMTPAPSQNTTRCPPCGWRTRDTGGTGTGTGCELLRACDIQRARTVTVTVTNLSQASPGRPSPRALKPRLRYKLPASCRTTNPTTRKCSSCPSSDGAPGRLGCAPSPASRSTQRLALLPWDLPRRLLRRPLAQPPPAIDAPRPWSRDCQGKICSAFIESGAVTFP